jgi:hypothetical protein
MERLPDRPNRPGRPGPTGIRWDGNTFGTNPETFPNPGSGEGTVGWNDSPRLPGAGGCPAGLRARIGGIVIRPIRAPTPPEASARAAPA